MFIHKNTCIHVHRDLGLKTRDSPVIFSGEISRDLVAGATKKTKKNDTFLYTVGRVCCRSGRGGGGGGGL